VAAETERERIVEAYIQMAEKAKYRPQAPSDGFGNIELSEEDLADPEVLADEAAAYADRFIEDEDRGKFHIGVSDWYTNRALVYTIEAARLLCMTRPSAVYALKLLEMAAVEVKEAIAKRERSHGA
jgi:hypothetical protein